MNLRWKIQLALTGFSVATLALSLFFVSDFSQKQLQLEIERRAENVGRFAQAGLRAEQNETSGYLLLLGKNPDLKQALQRSLSHKDTEPLKEFFRQVFDRTRLNHLQVLDDKGSILHETGNSSVALKLNPEEDPALIIALIGEVGSAIVSNQGRLGFLTAVPLLQADRQIGVLVGMRYLDDDILKKIASLSLADLAIFSQGKLLAASTPGLRSLAPTLLDSKTRADIELQGAPHALFGADLEGMNQAGLLLSLDLSETQAAREELRQVLILVLIAVLLVASLLGLLISGGITGPLKTMVRSLIEIAEGEGDLTRQVQVSSRDEIGRLAKGFNRFTGRLRETILRVRSVSQGLAEAGQKIRKSALGVNESAALQAQSVDASIQIIQTIDVGISEIAANTSVLVEATQASASAVLEMGATVEQIDTQMEKLFQTVDHVTSSITQISASSQEVGQNIDILASATEATAASITQLDASIKEIEEGAESTCKLSEQAANDAREGKTAVDQTLKGIEEISRVVDQAGSRIHELGDKSKAIGKIVTVIDAIADQTSLLALNAAIIAAQAGEHGNAFAVVADEIRELSDRTALSTREISDIVGAVQAGTLEAVAAMKEGRELVHQEVRRSQLAGAALAKILGSSQASTNQVRAIVRATQEQAKGSRQITDSMNQIADMLEQISSTISQQNAGTRLLTRAAEDMKEIAAQSKLNTGEHAQGAIMIGASIEKIRHMASRIDAAAKEHLRRNREMVESMLHLRSLAESNINRTAELDQVVDILSRQTATLEKEMGAFKV